jgi:hypothetical protein
MLNFKEKELSENLFYKLKEDFPTIELVEIIKNSFDGGDVWMRVVPPLNRQERNKFSELTAQLSTDILMEYGYDIVVRPVTL